MLNVIEESETERRYAAIENAGTFQLLNEKQGTIRYVISSDDTIIQSAIDENTLSIDSNVIKEGPVYVLETKAVDTSFAADANGRLTVQYEDPSYYWSFPDESDKDDLTHANEIKTVYIHQYGSVPNDFVPVRAREGRSFSSSSSSYISLRDDRQFYARGRALYIYVGNDAENTDMDFMSPVLAADGFAVAPQFNASNSFAIRNNNDGTVDLVCEEKFSVRVPATYHVQDKWVRLPSSIVMQSSNLVSSRVDSNTDTFIRLFDDTSHYSFHPSGQSSLVVELRGGGLEGEIQMKRLIPGDSTGTYLLRAYEMATSENILPHYRQKETRIDTQRRDGHTVPFDSTIITDLDFSKTVDGTAMISDNLLYFVDVEEEDDNNDDDDDDNNDDNDDTGGGNTLLPQTIVGEDSFSIIVVVQNEIYKGHVVDMSNKYSANTNIQFSSTSSGVSLNGSTLTVLDATIDSGEITIQAAETETYSSASKSVIFHVVSIIIPPYMKRGQSFLVKNTTSSSIQLSENSEKYDLSVSSIAAGETANVQIIYQP